MNTLYFVIEATRYDYHCKMNYSTAGFGEKLETSQNILTLSQQQASGINKRADLICKRYKPTILNKNSEIGICST